jgi:hypothetical protein
MENQGYRRGDQMDTTQSTTIEEPRYDQSHYNVRSEEIFVHQLNAFQALPDLRKVAMRSLITGVVLVLNGAGYFMLGLFSVTDDPNNAGFGHATTIVVGLLVIGAGSVCIFMKFRLVTVVSCESLIRHTWFYIVFGCIILGCSLYAFAMLIYLLASYIGMVDEGNIEHIPDRTKAAIGCVLAFFIIILSCVMLSCSVSIRKLVKSMSDELRLN